LHFGKGVNPIQIKNPTNIFREEIGVKMPAGMKSTLKILITHKTFRRVIHYATALQGGFLCWRHLPEARSIASAERRDETYRHA